MPNVFKTACGCQKCPITTNECQNETSKERIVFLAIYIDLQGNMRVDINHQGIWIVPWRFLSTSKEISKHLSICSVFVRQANNFLLFHRLFRPIRLAYKPYFFSQRIIFFSHNKLANSTFSHGLSAK